MIAVMDRSGKLSIILHAMVVLPDLLPVPAISKRFGISILIIKSSVYLCYTKTELHRVVIMK